jgi:hypothetical protein
MESLKCIQNYKIIFRKVIREAKKKDIDRFILSAKSKNKTLLKLMNKNTGNIHYYNNYIIINNGDNIFTNPQIVSDRSKIFFEEVIEDLLSQNNCQS